MQYHEPVLVQEVLEYLHVNKSKKYIDATLGDAGHSVAMLTLGAHVLGLDYDKDALARAQARITTLGLQSNFTGVLGNFKDIVSLAQANGFAQVDGILFDLGYSSYQLDEGEFGLSFQRDEPLDMRIDKSMGVTAADLVNTLPQRQLQELFSTYGDVTAARTFSEAIVARRKLKPFQTTKELADLLVDEAPSGYDRGKRNPATKVFQALRIVVNDELENLKIALPQAAQLLKLPGGRMAIISFHSLEDKVAKNFGHAVRPRIMLEPLTKKPVQPTEAEIKANVRSRSAKLRVYEAKLQNSK